MVLFLVTIWVWTAPASADRWYEHYARAEAALAAEQWGDAIAELNQALERRADSGARVRTYGMHTVDYFPYLRLGIAYLGSGQPSAALRALETEERLGAIVESQPGLAELRHYRQLASSVLLKQREEEAHRRTAIVERSLTEAAELAGKGRFEDALAAAARAEAVDPDNPGVASRVEDLRQRLAREQDQRRRQTEAGRLETEAATLISQGRLADAAARLRQSLAEWPSPRVEERLTRVDEELAATVPSRDDEVAVALTEARRLADAGRWDESLAQIAGILAVRPESNAALELERQVLAAQASSATTAEIARLVADAHSELDAGRWEPAVAAANRALALERGNPAALEVIRLAYRTLGRSLLGEAGTAPLPPAIRFVDLRRPADGGRTLQVVSTPDFRLDGVILDEGPVDVTVRDSRGGTATVATTSQPLGGVQVTELTISARLRPGDTTFTLEATDSDGLVSRSDYEVAFRPPLWRSGRLWAGAAGLVALVAGVAGATRQLRRRRLRRLRYNPFIAGPPVLDETMLFGREQLIRKVVQAVPNNSVLLHGERRIGKTSLLHHIGRRLETARHPKWAFFPVSVDLQGTAEDQFFETLAHEVREAVGVLDGDSAPGSTDGDPYRDLVRQLRSTLCALGARTRRRVKLVLLIDEVDELNGYDSRTNQRFRSLFMTRFADSLVAVVAGVRIRREWDREGSPWYNFFEEIEVGPLDRHAARALLTAPLEGVVGLDEAVVERLLELTVGRPYPLQRFGLALLQRAYATGRTRLETSDLDAILDALSEREDRGD